MPFAILVIGIVLVVAAIRDTQSNLFSALATDVPAFVTWGAAILAVGAIGFIPDLKPISRALLALILVVLILRNYQNILAGFGQVSTPAGSSGAGTGNGSGGNLPGAPGEVPAKGGVSVTGLTNASTVLANVNSEIGSFSTGLGA